MPAGMPSFYDMSGTMPALGPNGELVGAPDPHFSEADPSKGTDIRTPDGRWVHMDPHKDRNGNYISPTTFLSDSLPGGFAAAFPDTDEYAHIGRVFRTDRNRAIGKMLLMIGGGALAANMGAGANVAGGVGDVGEGFGISPDFLSTGLEGLEGAGAGATGALAPLGADVMTVTAPALGGGLGATAGTLGGITGAVSGLGGAGGAGDAWTPEGGSGEISETPPNPLEGTTGGGEGLDALPGDVGMGSTPSGGGIFSRMGDMVKGGIHNADGSINWTNAIKLGTGATSMLGSLMGGGKQQTSPTLPPGWNDPAKFMSMSRERAPAMDPSEYATYGTKGGEHRFFNEPVYTPKADGGHVRGPGSGRSDDIDARLSDGEYVMDAETVALLGDGSLDEGSRRLDQLRANLRKHKGAALAKGKFSPAAKDPLHYVDKKAKGGLFNPQAVDVMTRNRDLLTRGMERTRTRSPLSPDMSSLSEQELNEYRRWLEYLKNLPPPEQKAKGGLTRIEGGIPMDPQIRLEQLAATQRMAAAARAKAAASEMNPPSAAIQGDREMVEAARRRLLRIKSLADSTPPPVAKAEGGAVKALTEFADRLEDTNPESVLAV